MDKSEGGRGNTQDERTFFVSWFNCCHWRQDSRSDSEGSRGKQPVKYFKIPPPPAIKNHMLFGKVMRWTGL